VVGEVFGGGGVAADGVEAADEAARAVAVAAEVGVGVVVGWFGVSLVATASPSAWSLPVVVV
jgi:hypothetical protein